MGSGGRGRPPPPQPQRTGAQWVEVQRKNATVNTSMFGALAGKPAGGGIRLGAKPTLGKKAVPGAGKGAGGANGAISADGRYVKGGAVPANKFSLLGESGPGSGGKSSLLSKKGGDAAGAADGAGADASADAKPDDADVDEAVRT